MYSEFSDLELVSSMMKKDINNKWYSLWNENKLCRNYIIKRLRRDINKNTIE